MYLGLILMICQGKMMTRQQPRRRQTTMCEYDTVAEAAAVGHGFSSTCARERGIDEFSLVLSLSPSLPPLSPSLSLSLAMHVCLPMYVCVFLYSPPPLSMFVRVYIYSTRRYMSLV